MEITAPTLGVDRTPRPAFHEVDFTRSPWIVIWELTRSCGLACSHCRASAVQRRHPDELSQAEGFRLIEEIARFDRPLFVLTGGDPMRHPHCLDFIEHGARQGLRVSLTPSGTSEMTRARIGECQRRGLERMAVSLDGATPETHDAFRRVKGSFGWTLQIIRWCRELGLEVQINTSITRQTLPDLERVASLLESLDVVLWSVFFLVPVGRGKKEDEIAPEDYERTFHFLYELSLRAPFDIKTTAAPHYRRVVIERNRAAEVQRHPLGQQGGRVARAPKAVNDGNGFCFISHTGEVWPSGFLPVSAGNVRRQSLVALYRESPLFRDLRDPDKLKGKCGVCEYREICGGSRARAYGMTGDYLADDPFCVYEPSGTQPLIRASSPRVGATHPPEE